jgi:hypothetical protein
VARRRWNSAAAVSICSFTGQDTTVVTGRCKIIDISKLFHSALFCF